MTDLNPKGLEAARKALLAAWSGGDYDEAGPLAAITVDAYIAASPTQPVEAEAVAFRTREHAGDFTSRWAVAKHRPSGWDAMNPDVETEPLFSAATVSALQARVRELEGALAELSLIGGQLANCAFNMSQPSSAVYDRDREVLKELCEKWDAARSALSPVQQEGGKP